MFKKVIIAEDFDTINIALIQSLEELAVPIIHHAKYCDDAFLKIRKAIADNQPYNLLICDLSFRADFRETKLSSGEELIAAARALQPDLKVIVYSIEDKSYRIKSLFQNHGINAYIMKGRNSMPELQKAIQYIATSGNSFLTPEILKNVSDKTLIEIDSYDIQLLLQLSKGLTINVIFSQFEESIIKPFSYSFVEKRIGKLRIYFKAINNVQLIGIAKDLGLI
jgi:DNA-binding NarL/FixJ family response regulator